MTLPEGIAWGKSKLGCDGCRDPRALAGWHVTIGTQPVYFLCSKCAASWTAGWRARDGRDRPPTPEQLTAA